MRKKLFDVEDETRLPESAYAPEVSETVYRRLREATETALKAGHSVIVDAVFDREDARDAIADVARAAGVSFDGVWLDVPVETMRARLEARRRDASDATIAVLEHQLAHDAGRIDWIRLPAAASADEVAARAAARLGLSSDGTKADPDLRL
jgi:predicted kinase